MNSGDRRQRSLSATTYDVNEQQRCLTTMITMVSTTGHRDVATPEAIPHQASRQLSTSSTTVNIYFRFDILLIIFIFRQLDAEIFANSLQYAHKTLFSNNMIRYSATRSRRKLETANTRSERDDVQRRSDRFKPGDPYIGQWLIGIFLGNAGAGGLRC